MPGENLLTIDLDDLSIEEVELIEDKTGVPIDEIQGRGVKKGVLMRCFVYIAKRRDNPSYTWEEAGKVKLGAGSDNLPLGGEPESSAPEETESATS